MEVAGNLVPDIQSDLAGFPWDHNGRTVLQYQGLVSSDSGTGIQHNRLPGQGEFSYTSQCSSYSSLRFLQWIALLPIVWKATHLVIISLGRYLLVPLLILCVSPSPAHPILPFPLIWAVLLVMIVGVSTGYFGTLPMIMAPKEVESEHRELAGEIQLFC